jgi:hypothetical protein
LVSALRARGLEVLTTSDAGLQGLPDEPQLIRAHAEGCVLFTHNVTDFCRLHSRFLREMKTHSGIIVAEQGFSVGERLRRLLRLAEARTAEDMLNRLEFLSNWDSRNRMDSAS